MCSILTEMRPHHEGISAMYMALYLTFTPVHKSRQYFHQTLVGQSYILCNIQSLLYLVQQEYAVDFGILMYNNVY